jgi:hypothetical protein
MAQTFPFQFFSGSNITPDVSNSNNIGSPTAVIANIYTNAISGANAQFQSLSLLNHNFFSSLGVGIITGTTAVFTNLTGTTITGTSLLGQTANVGVVTSNVGNFTGLTGTIISGTSGLLQTANIGVITSNVGNFTGLTGTTISGTSGLYQTANIGVITSNVGNFTGLTGTTVSGTSGLYQTANIGVITSNVGNFTGLTGTTISGTSGLYQTANIGVITSNVGNFTGLTGTTISGTSLFGQTLVAPSITGTTTVRSPYFVNTGIPLLSQLMWSGNTSVGSSGSTNTFVAISGGTALSVTGNATYFTQTLTSPVRITYVGTPTVFVNVQMSLGYTGTTTNITPEFGILKNGSGTGFMPRVRGMVGMTGLASMNTMMSLATNDYVQMGVSFPTANRIFVRDGSLSLFVIN